MENQKKIDVAIIMVSYNNILDLPSVRQAMEASSLQIQFVLVDNASSQIDSIKLAHENFDHPIVIQREKNYGFGSSCNRGVREVNADVYFFLNPDTSLSDPLTIDKLYTFLKKERPAAGIVAPRLRYLNGNHQETCRRFPVWHMPLFQRSHFFHKTKFGKKYIDHFLMRDYDCTKPRMVDWVQGSTLMIDAHLFHEIGGFDKRYFMYFEDTDLCQESWQRGRPVYYVPQIEVFHEYGKASASTPGMIKSFLKNRMVRAHILSWMKYMYKWYRHGKKYG